MLIAVIICVGVLFKRLRYITRFNISIYLVLAMFWVCLRVFSDQLSIQQDFLQNQYLIPLAIGLTSFVQVIVRYPLAKMGQKIHSRKIPIVLTFAIFMILAIPFIVVQTSASFIVLAVGIGVFAATFGMENLYFSENWSLKHVFITVALISFLPTGGLFVASILKNSFSVNNASLANYVDFIRWVLLALLIISFVVLIGYVFFHKERKETIRKDNVSEKNSSLESLKLKDLFKMSWAILFIGLANQLVFRQEVAKIQDGNTWYFIYILISGFSIVTALITSLILVKHFRVVSIVIFSRVATLIGIALGALMWFAHIDSAIMGAIFIFVFATSITMYETTLIGTMVHFDQKNKMLVLPIWLSVRSLGYAIGDTTGGALEVKYHSANNDSVSQWLALAGLLIAVAVSVFAYLPHVRKVDKLIYDNVDRFENAKFGLASKDKIWK